MDEADTLHTCLHAYIFITLPLHSSGRIRTLVAMATYIFHRLIMGKVEIENIFCLNGDIWKIFLQKCLLCSALCSDDFCQNS